MSGLPAPRRTSKLEYTSAIVGCAVLVLAVNYVIWRVGSRDMYRDDVMYAIYLRDYDRLRVLLADEDPDRVRPYPGGPSTPLWFAIHQKDKRAIQVVLECGADPNAVDEEGWTPLGRLIADARKSETEDTLINCAEVLLKFGADPEVGPGDPRPGWSSKETVVDFARHKGMNRLAEVLERGPGGGATEQ